MPMPGPVAWTEAAARSSAGGAAAAPGFAAGRPGAVAAPPRAPRVSPCSTVRGARRRGEETLQIGSVYCAIMMVGGGRGNRKSERLRGSERGKQGSSLAPAKADTHSEFRPDIPRAREKLTGKRLRAPPCISPGFRPPNAKPEKWLLYYGRPLRTLAYIT